MEKFRLNTKVGFNAAINSINDQCRIAMIKIGFYNDTAVSVTRSRVEIGCDVDGKILFGSDITFYPASTSLSEMVVPPTMNYGVTGSFTPNSETSTAETYRTANAGIAVEKWYEVVEIVTKFCKMYADFIDVE